MASKWASLPARIPHLKGDATQPEYISGYAYNACAWTHKWRIQLQVKASALLLSCRQRQPHSASVSAENQVAAGV